MSQDEARGHIDRMNWRFGVPGFQEAMGLTTDGVVGPATRDAVARLLADGLRLRPNFGLDEFRCTHCGRARVTARLLDVLQSIRNEIGPMGKDSSYRCEGHPLSIKTPNSQHVSGRAWDPEPDIPVSVAERHGAVGIGYAAANRQRCTHFDVRDGGRTYFQDN